MGPVEQCFFPTWEVHRGGWETQFYSTSCTPIQYPVAQKDTNGCLKFIKKTTGQAKGWKSTSTAYTQTSNQTFNQTHNPTNNPTNSLALSNARRKGKTGAGLSQDDRTAQGLDLTPKEEQLLARQVNVLCVCAQMMAIVCVWVRVLLTIFTGCAGKLQSRPLGAKERPALGRVKTTGQRKTWTSLPKKNSSWRGKSMYCVCALKWWQSCVRGCRCCWPSLLVVEGNCSQDRSAQRKGLLIEFLFFIFWSDWTSKLSELRLARSDITLVRSEIGHLRHPISPGPDSTSAYIWSHQSIFSIFGEKRRLDRDVICLRLWYPVKCKYMHMLLLQAIACFERPGILSIFKFATLYVNDSVHRSLFESGNDLE